MGRKTMSQEQLYQNRLARAAKIVEKFNLQKYVNVLVNYWSQNPPTAGHGFAHAVGVGVEAYQFGIDNRYEHPEYLFLGGLFHDIYRPAEGQHGEEDQTPGAEVVAKLFDENGLDSTAKDLIVGAIKSHDSWRREDNPPKFDLYLSLGDKSMMNTLLADSYVWINNRKRELENRESVYSNHIETLTSFYKYQIRAWEILMKYKDVIGIERPRNAYINTVKMTIEKYEEDPQAKDFNGWIFQQKSKMEKLENEFLQKFGVSKKIVGKVLALYNI
jgi:hypothetical protein